MISNPPHPERFPSIINSLFKKKSSNCPGLNCYHFEMSLKWARGLLFLSAFLTYST